MSTSKACPHLAKGSKLYIKQQIIFVFHLLLMCSVMWQQLWQEQWRLLTRNLQPVLANAAGMLWDDGRTVSLGKTLCSRKPDLEGLIWLHRQGTHSWPTATSPSSHLCEGASFTLTMVSALPAYLPHAFPCAAPQRLADVLLHLTPASDRCKLSDFTHGSFQLYVKYKPPVPDWRWDHCSRQPIYPKLWLQIRRKYFNLVLQESENKDGESSVQTQLYQWSSQLSEVKANNEAASLMAWRPSSWEYGKWGAGRRCLKTSNRDQKACSDTGFTSCWNVISVIAQRWRVLIVVTWWG